MKKKKYIVIICFCVLILSFVTCIMQYKIQIRTLNSEILKLKYENKQLHKDISFINKQYKDLKSTKSETEPIHLEVQECMKSCNYTTACMNNCVYDSENKWEKEIDKNIKLLEKIMTKNQINILHNSQKNWIAYKNSQQALNSKIIGTKTGTIYTNILAGKQVYLIELRAKELDGLYYIYSQK